ncbi:MAG: class I SAM-dependent methyltransferase [Acidimicrobiales bacterium]
MWPTLRLLGLGSGPVRHRALFARAVEQALAEPRPRLLVAGQADHAMAALVVEALAGQQARVQLLDRCATPVAAAQRWIGELRPDLEVAVEVGDARLVAAEGAADRGRPAVDLVVTHSFLSQVPPEDRSPLVAALGARLAPGGRLVTNTRLAPADDDGRFHAAEADRLRAALRSEADRRPELLPASVDAVVDAVGAYVDAVRIHPVHEAAEVEAAVADAGLVLERLDEVARPGAATGPGTAQAATYLEITARRPPIR